MSRATDWSPVDRHSDPTPGDNAEAAALAQRYKNTADEIQRQAKALRSLSDSAAESWDSEASKAFAKHADELAANITKAYGRYAAAAAALGGWTAPKPALGGLSPMEAAQQKADAALAVAVQAHTDLQANSPQPAPTAAPGQTAPDPQAVATHKQREAAYSDAQASLRGAIRSVGDAEDEYTAAAKATASEIDAVSHHDALHDSFWDGVSGWIHDHAAMIKSILTVVGWVVTALAVAALVVSLFVPGLDILGGALLAQVLTSVLEEAATAGIGLMLFGHSVLALNGDGSWLDVGLDLLALVGGGLVGKLTKAVGKGAADAVLPAADVAASRAATQFLERNARSISRWTKISKIPFLRALLGAGDRLDGFAAGATKAADAARQAVLDLPTAETTMLSRLRYAGEGIASGLGRLQQLSRAVPGVPEVAAGLATAHRQGEVAALVKYGLTGIDIANHDIEETTSWKKAIEPYVTYPVLPLPWKVLAPAGDGG